LPFLGKGKDKKKDAKKSNRNIIGEKTTSMNASVNVYLDDTHVSDNDSDLSQINTPPIDTRPINIPPITVPSFRKLLLMILSFSNIITNLFIEQLKKKIFRLFSMIELRSMRRLAGFQNQHKLIFSS